MTIDEAAMDLAIMYKISPLSGGGNRHLAEELIRLYEELKSSNKSASEEK